MAVQMVNDDLKGFVSRWDAVIAGMREDPGQDGKKHIFTVRFSHWSMTWQFMIAPRKGTSTEAMISSSSRHEITWRESVWRR